MEIFANHLYLFASICAGLCVMFATTVIIEFISFTSGKYRERFLQEAAVEMDDVLLQMPASRIFDLSLAIASLSMFVFGVLSYYISEEQNLWRTAFICFIAFLVAFPIPRIILRRMKKKRLQKFNDQLEDALLSMSSALKAGFSINQAIENVASENRYPVSFEFTLLIHELRLGVPFETALQKMSDRLESQDFQLIAIAIITARQTGGELTHILEELASVIRERIRIMHKIHALTAQGRIQAWLIAAVPFLLLFAMTHIAPDLMDSFFNSIFGVSVLIGVIIMVVIGFLLIRKITTIEV